MDEAQAGGPELRFDLRSGWVPVGPGQPEEGVRQPTLWGASADESAPRAANADFCPNRKNSPHEWLPYRDSTFCRNCGFGYPDLNDLIAAEEESDDSHCDWAVHGDDCDGVHSNRPYDLYDPGHPGVLNDSPRTD